MLEPGTKIEYRLLTPAGGEEWFAGVIHGVRKYEGEHGVIKKITYLVDTGRHERLDEYPFDHRDRELTKRINKRVADGETVEKILKDTKLHDGLPASKRDVEVVRQPEQLELSEKNIRLP